MICDQRAESYGMQNGDVQVQTLTMRESLTLKCRFCTNVVLMTQMLLPQCTAGAAASSSHWDQGGQRRDTVAQRDFC